MAKKCILGAIIIILVLPSFPAFKSDSFSLFSKTIKNVNALEGNFRNLSFWCVLSGSARNIKAQWSRRELFKRQFRELFLNRAIFYSHFDVETEKKETREMKTHKSYFFAVIKRSKSDVKGRRHHQYNQRNRNKYKNEIIGGSDSPSRWEKLVKISSIKSSIKCKTPIKNCLASRSFCGLKC